MIIDGCLFVFCHTFLCHQIVKREFLCSDDIVNILIEWKNIKSDKQN